MSGSQEHFQQAMNQGHSAAWDQSWENAASYYRQALEEFPNHPQALTNLGLALYELQEYDESLQCYQKAAQVSPDDPLPLEKVAQLFERVGNLEQASQASLHAAEIYLKNRDVNKAIENWSRVTRLTPENLQAHSRLALVFERMGDKKQAVTEFLAVASLFQAAGDLEKAVRALNQALQVSPNDTSVLQAMAMLRDYKPLPKPTRPRGGTAPLRMSQVRQLDPPKMATQTESGMDPIALARQRSLTVLAGMLFEGAEDGSDEQGTRRGLQAIIRGTGALTKTVDRSRIVLHLGQVVDLQTHGQGSQAAEELERAIEAGLDHAAAYFDLGFLHAESGRLESALRQLQYAVKHQDFALGARLLSADILRKMARVQEASVEFLEALKLADALVVLPEHADDLRQLYEPLIEAQQQQQDPQALVHLCDNVSGLLMRPDWKLHLTRAREQLPLQDKNSPPTPLAEILTEARSSQVVDSIATIHDMARSGNLRSAMEEAFYALQSAPTYLPLHTFMGDLLLKQDRLQDAIAKFQVVARTYSVRGEAHRSIDLYRRVIELAPMDMSARTRLIDQLTAQGRMDDAIAEYLELANVYYSLADLEMARKTFTDALRLSQQPKVDQTWRVKIMHRMADIDMQSLDWRQALRIFEQIRTLQPDDEKARANLIELNLRLGQETAALAEIDNYVTFLGELNKVDKGLAFLQGLVNENPERVIVRYRLAELYRLMGQIPEAIDQLDSVGEMLLEAGDRKGAAQAIEAILALNPPNADDYHKLLASFRA